MKITIAELKEKIKNIGFTNEYANCKDEITKQEKQVLVARISHNTSDHKELTEILKQAQKNTLEMNDEYFSLSELLILKRGLEVLKAYSSTDAIRIVEEAIKTGDSLVIKIPDKYIDKYN